MSQDVNLPKPEAKSQIQGRTWGPNYYEKRIWQQLFNEVFPHHSMPECSVDTEFIKSQVSRLESAALEPDNKKLAVVYRRWLQFLNEEDLKREREKVSSAAWGKAWREAELQRLPLHEASNLALLASRRAGKEFDYPDEPKAGVDPSLDALRLRYAYLSYTRVEVRTAVEEELKKLRDILISLRSIAGEKFNHYTLPFISRAITNFLEAKPTLNSSPLSENGTSEKQIKESTRLKSLIEFADLAQPIIDALVSLQTAINNKAEYLEELSSRLNAIVKVSTGRDVQEETLLEKWAKDFYTFELSRFQSFELVRQAWASLSEFAGIELLFNPKYTDQGNFKNVIHYQEKTSCNPRITTFCQAWLTYLETTDLEAARNTFVSLNNFSDSKPT